MQHHLDVMGDKVRETFANTDFETLEIYGALDEELKASIPRVSEADSPTIRCTGEGSLGVGLGTDTLSGMNTTRLIEQWSMEGARRELESRFRSANDIRALLLGDSLHDQVEVVRLPVWDGDGDPPVFFKDPRDAHGHSLEDT